MCEKQWLGRRCWTGSEACHKDGDSEPRCIVRSSALPCAFHENRFFQEVPFKRLPRRQGALRFPADCGWKSLMAPDESLEEWLWCDDEELSE